MSTTQSRHYFIIWLWLVGLVGLAIAASSILPKTPALALIFFVAIVKALLVVRNYMHLKNERPIYYAIVLVPLAFVVIFLFGLFPDFVFHTTKP